MFISKSVAQQFGRTSRAVFLMGFVALVLALSGVSASAEDSFGFVGFDPAAYSPDGQAGLAEIFSGRLFAMAMPLSIVEAMAAEEAARASELGYDPSSIEGKFYSSGALPSPPGRDVDENVSLGQSVFEKNGAVLTGGNCFACHAGIVNGIVVAGLGNNGVMQRPPRPDGTPAPNMFKLASALKNEAEKKVMAEMVSRERGPAPVVSETTSRGDNFGPFAVWARGAFLADPENEGLVGGNQNTELVQLIENNMVPPVDPMAWWLMKYKVRDYWYGDGTPFDAAHFSFNFSSTGSEANENHENHVESTAKALAFARETQSPVYPGTLDPALVQKGADLFHGRTEPADTSAFKACFECHGIYTKSADQLDLSVPGSWIVDYQGSEELKKIRTDATYNEVLQLFRPISEHINKLAIFHAAQGAQDLAPVYDHLEGKGYVPPPLVGVWATAPYFHNGSVPTIAAVLNSNDRPEIWSREQSPHAYDLSNVGLEFVELSRVEYDALISEANKAPYKSKASLDQMFAYDTEGFGRGNMGHTFGDSLTTGERSAIIEFLKSLSGPEMPAASPQIRQAKR